MEILNDTLRQSFLFLLWIGSVAGILIGAVMCFSPQQVIKLNQYFSRWVGSGKVELALDRPRWTERFFYRYHTLVGAGVLIGALLILYTFLFRYNQRAISALISRDYWWLSDALLAVIVIGSGLAALIGTLVLTKPSLLREVEKASNRWVSTERIQASFNHMNFSAEQSIIRHHRIAGVFIMLGSIYILLVLGYFLFLGL